MIYKGYEPPEEDYFTRNDVDENGFMVNIEAYNNFLKYKNLTYGLNLPSNPRTDMEVQAAMRLIICTCKHDGHSLPIFEALNDPKCFLSYFLDSNDDDINLDFLEIRSVL